MKKSAVEWLESEMLNPNLSMKDILEQAKEMEKQQIVEAHAVGRIKECSGIHTDGEHYYNETFNI
jgi:hypothetical protein